jgi:Ca2+-binding RTX toxin-like protein
VAFVYGTNATDVLNGTDQADSIYGYFGNDRALGGAGTDSIFGGFGDDWLDGGDGNDRLIGSAGDDAFVGGAGNDTFDGSSSTKDYDWVGYDEERGTQAVVVNLKTGTATDSYGNTDTLIDIEEVSGTALADRLTGGNIANDDWEFFYGGAGADTIDGGSGFDATSYRFDTFDDGDNGIILNWTNGTVRDGFGNTDIISNMEMVTATYYDDLLNGNALDNRFDPLWGADVINGGAGIDTLSYVSDVAAAQNSAYSVHGIDADLSTGRVWDARGFIDTVSGIEDVLGTAMEDVIRGHWAANFFNGYGEDDILSGRAGNDSMFGNDGNDVLYGGRDNDVLEGGTGEDMLFGNSSADIFYIDKICDHDVIRDYQRGVDKIDLTEFNFTSGAQVLGLAVQRGGNVVIELSSDSTIEFWGTTIGNISAADFFV